MTTDSPKVSENGLVELDHYPEKLVAVFPIKQDALDFFAKWHIDERDAWVDEEPNAWSIGAEHRGRIVFRSNIPFYIKFFEMIGEHRWMVSY